MYVVGLRDRNLVAIAYSQPAASFDESLLDAILASVELPSAPVYSDGDLVTSTQDAFVMPIPGTWQTVSQPQVGGVGLSGVWQFGEGEVLVSIGSANGTLGWCDPTCRELPGLTDLAALEAAVRNGQSLGPTQIATLDGEAARTFGTDTPAERRYIVSVHDGHPVAIRIDTAGWTVASGIVEEMTAGFAFADAAPATADQTLVMADGRVELALSDAWHRSKADPELIMLGANQVMTVRVGDIDGRIVTCVDPAAPWELCREIQATSLEDLTAAVLPAPIQDHGVGPPEGRVQDVTLDGQPAVLIRIQAYEYPAKSGQEVAYLVALHDGRPLIIRLRTTSNELRDLDSVLAGITLVP